MNRVELMAMLDKKLQRIGLVKLKRKPRHRSIVHADNIEAGAVITDSRTTCARKQIEQTRPSHPCTTLTTV